MSNLNPQSGTIKATRCDIDLGTIKLDAYMMPDGEKRLGMEGTSLALGYTVRWFHNRTNRKSEWLSTLRGKGFSGVLVEASVARLDGVSGASKIKSLSKRDFTKLVGYEAVQGNKSAIILLSALSETGLDKILDDAFAGQSLEPLAEKIQHYASWSQAEYEEVLQYNRDEVEDLALGMGSWGASKDDKEVDYGERCWFIDPCCDSDLSIGSRVAHADPYFVAAGFHGTVEAIAMLGGEKHFTVRWEERRGKVKECEAYPSYELKILK